MYLLTFTIKIPQSFGTKEISESWWRVKYFKYEAETTGWWDEAKAACFVFGNKRYFNLMTDARGIRIYADRGHKVFLVT